MASEAFSVRTEGSRRQERREAILEVAQACFISFGYGATSMSTIAAQLGGSKGTLYNYFPSKQALFEGVIRRRRVQWAEGLASPAAQGDLTGQLEILARSFLDLLLDPESIAIQRLVIGEGERFPELGPLFYSAGPKQVIERTAEIMRDLMRSGRLRAADPNLAAQQFKDLATSGLFQQRLWGVIDNPSPDEQASRACVAVAAFLRLYQAEAR